MAAKPKLKAIAMPAAQSQDEVDLMIGKIGEAQRKIESIDAALTENIADLKAHAKKEVEPLQVRIGEYLQAIMSWAQANKDSLTADGRRTINVSQGSFGWRWPPPSVKVKRGCVETVIETLRARRLKQFLRTITELDKEAILRAPDLITKIPDIEVRQDEVFFVKPLKVESEMTATVSSVFVPTNATGE